MISQPDPLPLTEITKLLLKHFDIREGEWDLALEFQIAVGQVGPDPSKALPGAMLAVSRIGVVKATQHGPNTVDASQISGSSNSPTT